MAPQESYWNRRESSNHSVDQTVQELEDILKAKGVQLFAMVDHGAEAQRAGLKMSPTKLLTLGVPRPARRSCWLPQHRYRSTLKILVREKEDGKVWVSYNSPSYLKEQHGLIRELLPKIAIIETLASKIGRYARRHKRVLSRRRRDVRTSSPARFLRLGCVAMALSDNPFLLCQPSAT
jgi:uncharacterized protein (DUF302 family)